MRLRNQKEYTLKQKIRTTDEELNERITYEVVGSIKADIQPASGRIRAEIYGVKMMDMLVAYTKADVKENQVITYEDIDYKVVAKKRWYDYLIFDLERVEDYA